MDEHADVASAVLDLVFDETAGHRAL